MKRNRFVKETLVLGFVFAALAVGPSAIPAAAVAEAPDARASRDRADGEREAVALAHPTDMTSKKILIIHSFAQAQPAYKIIDESLTKAFVAGGVNFNNLYFEYLDLARNPGREYRQGLIAFLRNKYKGRKLDLVISIHPDALAFLRQEGRDIYPRGPIVSILDEPGVENSDPQRPLISLRAWMDVTLTARDIFSLKPDTQKILLVCGSSAHDRRLANWTLDQLKKWKEGLDVEATPPLPLADILKKVSQLPPKTAILYTTILSDTDGKSYMPADVGRMISRSANVPVFGMFETLLGDHGVVGGTMMNHRVEAERAVRAAMEILGGKLPAKPLTVLPAPLFPMFDWQQLERWGLKASALPAGAILLNKPVSTWERYRVYILAGAAFFFGETSLIVFLLIQTRQRRRAETHLRDKTQELDQFFNLSPDLLCIADDQGFFLRLNPAWARMLGYTREELMAKPFLDLVHADDRDRTREMMARLALQREVSSFKNRYRCKDGSYRWLEWAAAPAGKIRYAAARDITEHKAFEDSLRRTEEKYRRIFEGALEGIFEAYGEQTASLSGDPAGIVPRATFNPALAQMLGYESVDEIKSFIMDGRSQVWVNPDDRAELGRVLGTQGIIRGFECQLWRKDRTKIWVSINGRRISGPDGKTAGYSGFIEDITERRRDRDVIRESEAKYRHLHESMMDGYCLVDMDGVIKDYNETFLKMTGYETEELRRLTYRDLTPVQWHDFERAIVEEQVLTRGYSEIYEKEYRRKDGTVFPIELRTVLLKDASGANSGMWAIIRDISGRKRAEEALREHQRRLEDLVGELKQSEEHLEERVRERTAKLVMAMNRAEEANRAKSAFLANMSHELRTPLTSILGISQLMERDSEFPPKHREMLKTLSRSGKHLFGLIDDILEMSRIEADQSSVVRTSFDLYRFLEDLIAMIIRGEKKNLNVVLESESTLPKYIRTDERKLRQILLNLLANAVKFTDEGRVMLRVKAKPGADGRAGAVEPAITLSFEVEDTGIGIPDADRDRIFEPFVQLPGRKAGGGAGLGLPLSRKLARMIGGDIGVSSELGRGSTFTLEVAVEPADESEILVRQETRKVTGLEPGQPAYVLLVVDDSLENRVLLRKFLEPVGFRIAEAATGEEAVESYPKLKPALIWMDIRMPGIDGYEAARRIRELEKGQRDNDGRELHTPMIALTAGVMENEQSSPLSWVFDDWVYKPFRDSELFGKMEKHLGVKYTYDAPRHRETKEADTPVLEVRDLASLPQEWLKRFLRGVKSGRMKRVQGLIEEIRPEFSRTAGRISDLANLYKIETLIALTEKAMEDHRTGESVRRPRPSIPPESLLKPSSSHAEEESL
ncbi:MAG TPA: PAS domain S-box protein [Thermodesulfobacteriota bacterium]|nr:PAS domain S-box protein [Thermodesulfobacteriota bacterium]